MYGLSVYPITFDLGWNGKVKSRSLGINLDVYHRQLDIISVAWTIRQRSCQAERPLVSNFDTYCPFIQNLFSNFFSILA